MSRIPALVFALFIAAPLLAQKHADLIADFEGVKKSETVKFVPNSVQYEPRFDNGGGLGVGVNFYFGSRTSLEVKVAALESRLQVRRTGSDFIAVADVGRAQIYPITAIVQWHVLEKGAIRPYLGAGAGHVILRNVEKQFIGASGIEFKDPTGLVIDGGVLIPLGKRFSALADARYTPIETQAEATFSGTTSRAEIDVKPLIVSFGLAYHF